MLMVCQASPTLMRWTKKQVTLGAEMALSGTSYQAHQTVNCFQQCLYTFVVETGHPCHHLKDWGRDLCLCNTHLWAAIGSNAKMEDPWSPCLLIHASQHPSWWDTNEECLPTCWELWEAKESPYSWYHWNKKPELTCNMFCYKWGQK